MNGPCLLDTDILSKLIRGKKRDPRVAQRAAAYLGRYGRFSFSLISRYEVLRGLKATQATTRLRRFDAFCQRSEILGLPEEVVLIAADLYADLRRKGQLIGDADLFIAATALHHGRVLVTANTTHFQRLAGLTLEDWTKP